MKNTVLTVFYKNFIKFLRTEPVGYSNYVERPKRGRITYGDRYDLTRLRRERIICLTVKIDLSSTHVLHFQMVEWGSPIKRYLKSNVCLVLRLEGFTSPERESLGVEQYKREWVTLDYKDRPKVRTLMLYENNGIPDDERRRRQTLQEGERKTDWFLSNWRSRVVVTGKQSAKRPLRSNI